MLRFLLVGMVAAVSLSALLLLSYVIMFDAITPVTAVGTARNHLRLSSKADEEYPVLVSSAVESQFMTLRFSNCSAEAVHLVRIKWNNEYWQVVNDGKVYLYSAYYDVRFEYLKVHYHYVRIIGMSVGKAEDRVYHCTLWYSDPLKPITIEAQVFEIWLQHWNRNPQPDTRHAYLFSCPIPLEIRDKGVHPSHVSLSSEVCANITTKLPVNKYGLNTWEGEQKENFVVCVKGMDFAKDMSIRLVEWLELLFILGVDKVFFYKYRVHKNLERVLKYYERKGRAAVVPMTLPGDQPNDPDLRTSYLKRSVWQKRRNEVVLYNDCLYRNMYMYEYVVPLDIDEIIMPVKSYSWAELLRDYRKENPQVFNKFASLSAQNTYFLGVYNSTRNPGVPPYYHMLQHKLRSANFSLYGHSVKSFVFTRVSKTIFNHYTLESLYYVKKTNHVMNTTHVQMNHYKDRCPREIYSQCQSKFLVHIQKDDTIDRYQKRLVRNVESVIRKLNLSVE